MRAFIVQRVSGFQRTFLALTLLMLLGAGSARGQEALKVREEKDVEYGKVENESLRLDLYTPAEPGKALRPALVFVHGGGWSGGDKGEFTNYAKEMAGRGYVAVTVNYRLAPKFLYPAALDDVQSAVRWLRKNAEAYHLDPKRIGAMGASAGGHLVSLLGVRDTRDLEIAKKEPSSRVTCVVDYFGRMDLTFEEPVGGGSHDYRPAFLGKTRAESAILYELASPITYVNKRTVPFFLAHGKKDKQVSFAQSERMLAALQRANIEATLLPLENSGHGFTSEEGEVAWKAAKEFLDKHLRPEK